MSNGRLEVFNIKLWAIGLTLDVTINKRETLQRHEVKTMAFLSDSQTAI
jgi:hypothetical protein